MIALLRHFSALLTVAIFGCSSPTSFGSSTADVTGTVTLPKDNCSKVVVVLCDADSGVPIDKTGKPFTEKLERFPPQFVQTLPDAAGKFAFTNVAPGNYRVVAQAWERDKPLKHIFEPNGETVHLLGATNFKVPSSRARHLLLSAPGTDSIRIDQQFPNDGGYLLLSTEPPIGDPILGFLGWGTNFTKNIIGMNTMPRGRTIVHGVSKKALYATIFANDNNPGFGATKITNHYPIKMPIVASWSDGHHQPPAELEWLVDSIEKNNWRLADLIGFEPRQERTDKNAMAMQQRINAKLRPILNNAVSLPDGKKTRVADILAASRYVELRKLPSRKAD